MPEIVKNKSLPLFGVFYYIGIHLVTISYWLLIVIGKFRNFDDEIKKLFYIIPFGLSLIQLLLGLLVFRKETPKFLCEDEMEDKAMKELAKIFKDVPGRLSEFSIIKDSALNSKAQYPNYLELFSKQYILWILLGIGLIGLRCNSSSYLLTSIDDTDDDFYYTISIILMILPIVCIMMALTSLCLIKSIFNGINRIFTTYIIDYLICLIYNY